MNTAVARTTSQTMRVTQKGEESAAQWIKGVLDGSGSSPAQIIVAVVIGCIPFVGQGVDVGNVIVSVVKIAEKPEEKIRQKDYSKENVKKEAKRLKKNHKAIDKLNQPKEIRNFVERKINYWQIKDEFETYDEYKNRVRKENREFNDGRNNLISLIYLFK
jgi:hypothetical protein